MKRPEPLSLFTRVYEYFKYFWVRRQIRHAYINTCHLPNVEKPIVLYLEDKDEDGDIPLHNPVPVTVATKPY